MLDVAAAPDDIEIVPARKLEGASPACSRRAARIS